MKLWRKMANKVVVNTGNGPIVLTGRELKRYNQHLTSSIKPASNLMLALIKRI